MYYHENHHITLEKEPDYSLPDTCVSRLQNIVRMSHQLSRSELHIDKASIKFHLRIDTCGKKDVEKTTFSE